MPKETSMRALKVCHKYLSKSVPQMHAKRLIALLSGVESLLMGSFLTVTALGRGLSRTAFTKHNIKCMDRLLSNGHLHQERMDVYRVLCHRLCGGITRPVILVDWSDIVEQDRLMLIRAALVLEGRAITLYESIYPLKKHNSPKTHRRFLQELKSLLPETCTPIIVTDAGFRGPWFNSVEALGWYWLGRVRNSINYRLQSRNTWRRTIDLYYRANSRVQYLGPAELSVKRPYACHLYLYKKRKQHRKANRSCLHYAKHSNGEVFAAQQKEPWLLATNLSPEAFTPKQIVQLYGKRMQIEEGFRDLKSDKFGFGITLSRTKNVNRLNILLLIAALATWCLWLIGLFAQQQGWHRHFQANTVTDRKVLSIPFLALQVLRREDYFIRLFDLEDSHDLFLALIKQANEA
jgi:hypothetical protein